MTAITLNFESTSATPKQKVNAKSMFGAKGDNIVAIIESLVKSKGVDSSKLDHVLTALKKEETATAYADSAVGKKNILVLKTLLKAKSVLDALEVISKIKVPKTI